MKIIVQAFGKEGDSRVSKPTDEFTAAVAAAIVELGGPDLSAQFLPRVATAKQVASFLQTKEEALAQDRYLGRGVPFIKFGKRIRYLREDVLAYLAANRIQRTDDPRGYTIDSPRGSGVA